MPVSIEKSSRSTCAGADVDALRADVRRDPDPLGGSHGVVAGGEDRAVAAGGGRADAGRAAGALEEERHLGGRGAGLALAADRGRRALRHGALEAADEDRERGEEVHRLHGARKFHFRHSSRHRHVTDSPPRSWDAADRALPAPGHPRRSRCSSRCSCSERGSSCARGLLRRRSRRRSSARPRAVAWPAPPALRRRRPGSSSTWSAPSGGRGSTGFPPGRGSPTRSRAPAAPRGGPTLRRSTSPPRWPTASRCSCPAMLPRAVAAAQGAPVPGAPVGPVQLSVATAEQLDALPGIGPVTAQKIIDYRAAHGALRSVDDLDDDPGHRPCARRAAARAGGAVRKVLVVYPYVLAGAACAGLALSNAARVSALAVALLAVGAAFAAAFMADPRARIALLALALLLAGWWWGSLRLNALDSSVLAPLAGQRAAARVVVTGPARTGDFDLRVPAKLTRFGSLAHRRARAAPAPARPRAAPGRHPRARRAAEAAAPGLQRLRRAHLAPASRRPRGRPGKRLAHRRPPGRDRRLRGPRPRVARALARTRAHGRAPRGPRRHRARRGRRPLAGPPGRLPGLGALPPAGGERLERHVRRPRRPRARLGARPAALARPPGRARRDRLVRARRRRPAVRDPGGDRGRPRIARLARGAGPRPVALPARGSAAAAGLEPVHACSTPASSSRSPRSRRSSSSSRGRSASSRATRCRRSSPMSLRSRSPAES